MKAIVSQTYHLDILSLDFTYLHATCGCISHHCSIYFSFLYFSLFFRLFKVVNAYQVHAYSLSQVSTFVSFLSNICSFSSTIFFAYLSNIIHLQYWIPFSYILIWFLNKSNKKRYLWCTWSSSSYSNGTTFILYLCLWMAMFEHG